MSIALVTTWGTSCGIASHSAMLVEALAQVDPTLGIQIVANLHPSAILDQPTVPDITILNYHAALHSQWTVASINAVRARGGRVLTIFHDSGVPNSEQCKSICRASDYFILHEPYDDLPAHGEYLRQGVPALTDTTLFSPSPNRPMLGTGGHDFPWKCWTEMAVAAKNAGWGLTICTPALTEERRVELRAANPWLVVHQDLSRSRLLSALHACDATAWTNVCHNTGQSAAILQGIGARKPVLAFSTCRQYRSLLSTFEADGIYWVDSFEALTERLPYLILGRFDPRIVAFAEHDSWLKVGQRYAEILKGLA